MRRGHSGIGGWRSENTRHFRPRGGGNPHFRPRSYPLINNPRFPPPAPRSHRPPPFVSRLGHPIEQNDEQNRNKFRFDNRKNQNRPYEKHNDRSIYPQLQHFRHNEIISHTQNYKEPEYYDSPNKSDGSYVNSHGDVDHRQSNVAQSHLSFRKHPASSWVAGDPHKAYHYNDRNQNRPYRHFEEPNKIPLLDYPGHRPPSSDHYGGNPTPTIENSNTFSRSVDDTVNIVRKRLLNRNESLQTSDSLSTDSSTPDMHRENLVDRFNAQQEQPARRRIQKQGLKEKSNCDKIKNKIVHQLFKMDKEKIHKLMDNPNSSSKFEYAINSLITESQNSLNRHLRSVAEKTLCSSSTDFMQNDNNTIYEDTFLKQMQCLLDPQDTVFLEDIKPIVMAELTKVLQLDDCEQHFAEDESSILVNEESLNYGQCDTTFHNYENYTEDYSENLISQQQAPEEDFRRSSLEDGRNQFHAHCDKKELINNMQPKPLFERRQRTKSCTYSEDQVTSSQNLRHVRHSLDNKLSDDDFKNIDVPSSLFGPCTREQLSEDEDPFAELDNQYHVVVDHNFISTEDTCNSQQSGTDNLNISPIARRNFNTLLQTPEKEHNIKQEIDTQIMDIAKSPLKLSLNLYQNPPDPKDSEHANASEKQQLVISEHMNAVNIEEIPVTVDNTCLEPEKPLNSCIITKSLALSNSRKRPIDKQTSHRKEKRKKIEKSTPDINQKNFKKNGNTNIADCISKISGKCDMTNKTMSSVIYSKNYTSTKIKEMSKDGKKLETVDKEYSDKYVKRKNNQKIRKEINDVPKKKQNPDSSNLSQANNKNDTTSNVSQIPSKMECKNTLKTIDMFIEKPKKFNIHQAHRNTAIIPSTSNFKTNLEKIKKKRGSQRKKLRRHIATQIFKIVSTKETQTLDTKSFCTKFCQTEQKKLCVQAVQTEPMYCERAVTNSTDAFERMKEIDLEIQVLLQEKFKLYSSLENKDSSQNSLETLGMTVLNVTPFEEGGKVEGTDEDCLPGDAIVDDFTNIPVEELEQIALESVEAQSNDNFRVATRSRRQVVLEQERKSSVSPRATKKTNKKVKTPNISLIEQIITDDRPLEDIIALDDLEKPIKTRNKAQKVQYTKRKVKKSNLVRTINCDTVDTSIFEIKECSVVLVREDLNKLLIQNTFENYEYQESLMNPVVDEPTEYRNFVDEVEIVDEKENTEINDVQFDMLDVSEDIVIGDSCEIKSIQDKEFETVEVPINDEIILDNSQSSEDILAPATLSGDSECIMYDYSADENLCRDTITVTGNADAVLAIECIENNFIAACLDGNVYHFNSDGQLINTLRGSNLAVTCLTIVKEKYETIVYTGSLDSRIRYYDLETGIEKGPECNVLSPIQTMDRAWDTVFVGTRTGFVLQFECKNNMLIPVSTVKFSDQSILALRAMKEGPRKVLLVAARSENVTIKDAQTGLLLRTLEGPKMTVYTLLYEDGKVYCGTSSHQIQVFNYTSGTHVGVHEGGKGAVCLRASGGLLFAGCYDGCVYVYREGEPRPMAQLRGPGLMLLSLAVVGSKIIAGYKDRSLYIWKIPLNILQEMIL